MSWYLVAVLWAIFILGLAYLVFRHRALGQSVGPVEKRAPEDEGGEAGPEGR